MSAADTKPQASQTNTQGRQRPGDQGDKQRNGLADDTQADPQHNQGKRHGGDEELQGVFRETLREGEERLSRSWPALLATGAVGGLDVATGVLGLLLVLQLTGSEIGGALAFSIGFIALTLAKSELFTENFLVPIAPIVAGRARVRSLLRLWAGTLVMNLVGGWVAMGLVTLALPQVRPQAITLGEHFFRQGIGLTSFASAVLAGVVITLMTWMQRGTDSPMAKLVAAVAASFLLAAGHLNHAIVASLEMFAALQSGAPYSYGQWLALLGWAVLGNIIGGVLFVTVLRLVQVGAGSIRAERHRAEHERPAPDA